MLPISAALLLPSTAGLVLAVIHAYSDVNLGDRLLVELTLARLEQLGFGKDDCTIVALDGASFHDLGTAVRVGTPRRAVGPELISTGMSSIGGTASAFTGSRIGWGALHRLVKQVDGFVAVGGGYLRAGDAMEQAGVMVNHYPQLAAAARSGAPTCYLPQSVGPLRGAVGRLIRKELSKIDQVWLRDDTSVSELGLENASRCPDLAVLEVADRFRGASRPSGRPVLIARELDSSRPDYVRRLLDLARQIGDEVAWAVQTGGAAEKSDANFYEALGVEPDGSTDEVLRSVRPAAVVSVRLHGSIMALAAGYPTIHLTYQRKGWSAMHDLGLGDWVHDAGRFDPVIVAGQVEALRRDPAPYWEAVGDAVPKLKAQSLELTEHMGALLSA